MSAIPSLAAHHGERDLPDVLRLIDLEARELLSEARRLTSMLPGGCGRAIVDMVRSLEGKAG